MLFFQPFIQHAISAMLIGVFLALGLYTFGEPLLFDRVFFTALFLLALAFRKDINLLGVTLIIIAERLTEEIGYALILDSLPLKFLTYGLCLYALTLRRNDMLFFPTLATLLIMISTECYWWQTEYKFLNTHWYAFLIALNLMVRKAISIRCFWTLDNLKKGDKAETLKIDYYIYQMAGAFTLINIAILAEYLLRHVLKLPILVVYEYYPIVTQGLAFLLLFFIADQSIKVTRSKLIQA